MNVEEELNAPTIKSWKRLSKAEAAEQATQLAVDFLQSQDANGWEWTCGEATPVPSNSSPHSRKASRYWHVGVYYSKNGSILDGPASLKIDLEDGSVAFV